MKRVRAFIFLFAVLLLYAGVRIASGTVSLPWPGPGLVPGVCSASRTFITHAEVASSVAGVATFTGVNIGTASADRYVIVTISAAKASGAWTGTIDTLLIGAAGATKAIAVTSSSSTSAIYALNVTTGTTATIAATLPSSGDTDGASIGVYQANCLTSGTATGTGSGTGTGSAAGSLTIPASGFGIGSAGHTSTAGAISWTNLTLDYTVNPGTEGSVSSASSTAAGTLTRTATASGGAMTVTLAAWH